MRCSRYATSRCWPSSRHGERAARPCPGSGGRRPGWTGPPRARCRCTRGSSVAGAAHHRVAGVDQAADLVGVRLGADRSVLDASPLGAGRPPTSRTGTAFRITGTLFQTGGARASRRPEYASAGSPCRLAASHAPADDAIGRALRAPTARGPTRPSGTILADGLRRGARARGLRSGPTCGRGAARFADAADLARRVAGGLPGARRATRATPSRSSSPTGPRRRPLLGDRVPRRGSGADRPLLRAEGGRLHPPPVGRARARHRRPVRPPRLPRQPRGARGRSCPTSSTVVRRRRRRPSRRARPFDDAGRRRRRSTCPVPTDPIGARAHRLHVGHDRRPQGRRALAPHHRLRDPPARRRCSPTAARPTLVGAPVGHGIGMLAGAAHPRVQARRRSTSSTCGTRHACSPRCSRTSVSSGSGATFFLTSLLDHPDFTDAHRRADAAHRARRLAGPGGGRASAPTPWASRRCGATGRPSTPRSPGAKHDDPREKRLYTDGRPLPGVEHRAARRRRQAGRRRASPARSGARGPTASSGTPTPRSPKECFDADGWFATGDVGVLDDDGYLTIVDRKKDIIIRGGENVSALEVEELLAAPARRRRGRGRGRARRAARRARLRVRPAAAGGGRRSRRSTSVRAHLEAAGLARQKWPEELRGSRTSRALRRGRSRSSCSASSRREQR